MRREEPRTGQTETRQPGATPRNAQGEMRRDETRTGQGQTGADSAQRQGEPRVEGRVNISAEHATRVGEVLRERGGAERVNVNVRVGERMPDQYRGPPAAAGGDRAGAGISGLRLFRRCGRRDRVRFAGVA